jgi:hypothetical protein
VAELSTVRRVRIENVLTGMIIVAGKDLLDLYLVDV